MSARIDGLEVDPGDDVDLTIGFDLGGLRIGAELSRRMRQRPPTLTAWARGAKHSLERQALP